MHQDRGNHENMKLTSTPTVTVATRQAANGRDNEQLQRGQLR